MRSPIRWFGGKGNFTQHLLPLIPDHKCYVEVFGGGASLLFAKPPSKVEVYNDIDGDVVAFFRLFHDPVAFKEFKRKCFYTPYSYELFYEYRDTWAEQDDPIERVYRWFIVIKMMFSGRLSRKGGCSFESNRGRSIEMANTIDNLDVYVERLRRVQIEKRSWEHIIPLYDTPDTFFYLDPPYIHNTRTESDSYEYEMTDFHHEVLIETLLDIEGKVLLSGYPNNIYKRIERQGWHRDDIASYTFTGMRKGQIGSDRTECLWRNYEIQPTLFDI